MLFTAPERNLPPPCDWTPTVRLWAVYNQEPARFVGIGQKRMADYDGRRVPVWDFNDVDVSFANNTDNKLYFFVTVDDVVDAHNVWAHAADARTHFPQADVPQRLAASVPQAVDAKIETFIPHEGKPPLEADRGDLRVYLFPHGDPETTFGPNLDWTPQVRLYWAVNTDVGQPEGMGLPGTPVLMNTGQVTQWVWEFKDVDVRAAQTPGNRIFFWVQVDDVPTYTNIWVHGSDARTLFPRQDVPEASCR